jgi:periplasmic protein TonB
MAQTAPLPELTPPKPRSVEDRFTLRPLVLADSRIRTARRPGSVAFSLFVHLVLAIALIVVPLFLDESLPAPDAMIRAFFVQPVELAPPPPPPPPPPAAVTRRQVRRAQAAPRPELEKEPPRFVAPIEVPEDLPPEEGLSLDMLLGGVEGGVEGGVPGGVVGGIVGGLPEAPPPPPPPKIVRVGGALQAPALLKRVEPEYPLLALQARLKGIVVVEAQVDPHGRVASVRSLRGSPLLAEAAVKAVREWVYKPLLLNGIPTPFLVTVTVTFNLEQARR